MAKFRVTSAPLPRNFRGTVQEFLDALIERLEISSDAEPFSESAEAPSGNQGPWFKNGTELYVWDEDTSAYIPLDLSASYIPQISASATAPDPEETPLWLKIEDNVVIGLFYYSDTLSEWVTEDSILADGSITTVELADNAVNSQKTANLAVTSAKLGTSIAFDRWEVGAPRDFIRMNDAGDTVSWRKVQYVSEDITLGSLTFTTIEHGLSAIPHEVQASLVYEGALDWHGFTEGDELVLDSSNQAAPLAGNGLQKTATEITCYSAFQTAVVCPSDGVLRNIESGWFLRIRYSAA